MPLPPAWELVVGLLMPQLVRWPRLVSRHKGMPLYELVPVLIYSLQEIQRLGKGPFRSGWPGAASKDRSS